MKLVTDPNILAQLNGNSSAKNMPNLTPVTDPKILTQLNNRGTSDSKSSWLDSLGEDLKNMAAGVGNAGISTLNKVEEIPGGKSVVNLLAPGTKNLMQLYKNAPINAVSNPKTYSYDVGDVAGNIIPFALGGEMADAARGAAEAVPLVGKLAASLAGGGARGVMRRGLGMAAYGAVSDPKNRLKGSLEGLGLGVAADTIPKVGYKFISGFRPQQMANKVIDYLGGGKSLEDNAKYIAASLKKAYKNARETGSALYNSVFDPIRDSHLYNGEVESQYQELPDYVLDQYDSATKKLHNNFLNNPTIQNAHGLKQQLGYNLRSLQKKIAQGGSSRAERDEEDALGDAKNAIDNDINNHLERIGGEPLKNSYHEANRYWAQNVVPYTDSSAKKLATGSISNPTVNQITNIFKNPEPSIEKIIQDLPQETRNKIIYNALGKATTRRSASNLGKAYENLDQQGLGSYVSPEIEKMFHTLDRRQAAKGALQKLTGGAVGYHVGKAIEGVPLLEIAGALGGANYAPRAMQSLSKVLPDIPERASKITKKSYDYLTRALMAAYLNKQGVSQ